MKRRLLTALLLVTTETPVEQQLQFLNQMWRKHQSHHSRSPTANLSKMAIPPQLRFASNAFQQMTKMLIFISLPSRNLRLIAP